MNTELTLESLYELIIGKYSQYNFYCSHGYLRHADDVNDFELYKPRTSWVLRVRIDYDIEQRYEVSIHLNYIIQKYDKPRFKKNVYTRKK